MRKTNPRNFSSLEPISVEAFKYCMAELTVLVEDRIKKLIIITPMIQEFIGDIIPAQLQLAPVDKAIELFDCLKAAPKIIVSFVTLHLKLLFVKSNSINLVANP